MVNYEQNESAVNVYLSRLTTEGARRAMRSELDKIAKFFSDGECDADGLEWHRLRISHTLKIRNWLTQNYKYSTANKACMPCVVC